MFSHPVCGCLQCLWVLIVGGTAGYLFVKDHCRYRIGEPLPNAGYV